MAQTIQPIAELPKPTVDSAPFWEACNSDKLMFQRCESCRHLFYYARRMCPACGSNALVWEASSGQGCVYSFTEVHVPFQGAHWADQVPYTLVLVDLDEGPRMLSRWLKTDGDEPAVGSRVCVVFHAHEGQKFPFFSASAAQNP